MKTYAFAGTTTTVLVSGEETDGAFAMLHVVKPSGSSTPPHSHERELEVCYVLSGTLSAETDGRIETRSPGDVLVLPPGRPHRLFNASGETVREVLLCAPAVFDGFVAAVGSRVEPYAEPRPMTEEDRQRLVETAPRFGIKLLRSADPETSEKAPRPPKTELLDGPGVQFEVLVRLGTGDQDLVMMRAVLEPRCEMPQDALVDQGCVFLVDGALEMRRAQMEPTLLQPGDAVLVPGGTQWTVRNTGDTPAHILVVSTVRTALRFVQPRSARAGLHDVHDAEEHLQ